MKPNKVLYEILEQAKLIYTTKKHKSDCLGLGMGGGGEAEGLLTTEE